MKIFLVSKKKQERENNTLILYSVLIFAESDQMACAGEAHFFILFLFYETKIGDTSATIGMFEAKIIKQTELIK